ncbi:MAG: sulfite exporter TauE/SafE family protein [Ruminococcaceae bacterium]|nr:sulfite exporter TauE/SafE family protein [Oscillospiraceae bacterium]
MSPQIILLMLASLLCAVLSGMGIGNAGLFVLYLTAVAGIGQLQAQGLNLIFFLVSAAAALLIHVKRRKIPWRLTLFLAVIAALAAAVGACVATVLPTSALRRLFGGMLVISGVLTLFGKRKGGKKSAP